MGGGGIDVEGREYAYRSAMPREDLTNSDISEMTYGAVPESGRLLRMGSAMLTVVVETVVVCGMVLMRLK